MISKIKKNILIVDDEEINRLLLGELISEEFNPLYAENGEEALEILRKREEKVSLILLDLKMPKIDGIQFIEIAKEDNYLSQIPIIVATSAHDEEANAIEIGAADFIRKPYQDQRVILARIRRIISEKEKSITIEHTQRDPLTRLYNKEYFFEYAKNADEIKKEESRDALVLIINNFAVINDLRGSEFGDELLKRIAETIKRFSHERSGIACRYSGGSFLMYLNSQEEVVYKDLLDSLTKDLSEFSKGANIVLKLGIYPIEDDSLELETSFKRAISLCKDLKNALSSEYVIYDKEKREKQIYMAELIADMRKGIKERQFKVFYQPKYAIQGDKPILSSAEALIRWFHPTLGFISPGIFIPLFENNGLIYELDRFVWNEVAKQIKEWKDKFGIVIPVSTNISRIDIYDSNLADELVKITKDNDLKNEELLLEITESAYSEDSSQIVQFANRVKELGFKIEMDDFGTGYSSLSSLSSLPIDVLKVDMSFVKTIDVDEKMKGTVKTIIDLAKLLSLKTIAEGVENEKQCQILKDLGCDIIQGYYFSKPVPPTDFEKFIEEKLRS